MAAPGAGPITPVPGQGNTITVNFAPLNPKDGDTLAVYLRCQTSAPNDVTFANGFTRKGTTGALITDRFQGIFTKRIDSVAAEGSLAYSFPGVAGGGNGRVMAGIEVIPGVDPANQNDGGARYNTTATLPATSASQSPFTIYAMWAAEFTAGNSVIPATIPEGFTVGLVAQTAGGATPEVVDNSNAVGSRTGILVIYKQVPVGGSTAIPALTPTWTGSPTDLKSASWIARGLAVEPPIGLPVKLGDSSDAFLSIIDTDGVQKAPAAVDLWLPGSENIAQLRSIVRPTMSHRGGSLNWPEYSEIAYDRSTFRGYPALEFSCNFTSDLVPFGNGDRYLDRAAGVTGNVDPRTMTWATLSSTYQNRLRPIRPGVFQPFYRLVDFIRKFGKNHTLLIDPKFGGGEPPLIRAMLDVCNASEHRDNIVIKFDSPITDRRLVDAAKADGYVTMNYWGTEIEKLTTEYHTDLWDWIGVRYDANQAMYDAAKAIGKPVWAGVIPDQAGYDLAATRSADMMMCSNVAGIRPVGI